MDTSNDTTKRCCLCKQLLPIYKFGRDKYSPDGLLSRCKTCRKIRLPRPEPVEEGMKRCTRCSQVFPETEQYFPKDKGKPKGLYGHCKKCNVDKVKIWAEAHPDKVREDGRKRKAIWRSKNIDKARDSDNKFKHSAKYKRWREEYCKSEHGKAMLKMNKARRKARERNALGSHTAEDIVAQYKRQKGKCYYCGKRVEDNWHPDHVIPLIRGGSNNPENIVIACSDCNLSKNRRLPHEWMKGGRLL